MGSGPAPAAIRTVPHYMLYILGVHYKGSSATKCGKPTYLGQPPHLPYMDTGGPERVSVLHQEGASGSSLPRTTRASCPASPPPSPGSSLCREEKGLSQVRMFAQLLRCKQKPLTQKSSVSPGLLPTGSIRPCPAVLMHPARPPCTVRYMHAMFQSH